MAGHFRDTAAAVPQSSGTVRRVAAMSKVSRRTLLATGAGAVAAATLSGCGFESGAEATASADDVALVEQALQDEAAFAGMCQDIQSRHRRLATRIEVVIAGQFVHEEALTASLEEPPPTSSGSVETGLAPTAISREASRLHERRTADCLVSQSGPLARLFASIAASHAVTATQWRNVK